MLETIEHARRRKAPIYGELLGTGQSAFPRNLLDPSPDDEGLLSCARQALDAAGGGDGIDVVFGDGLANAIDDERELRACRRCFPAGASRSPRSRGRSDSPGAPRGRSRSCTRCSDMRHGVIAADGEL